MIIIAHCCFEEALFKILPPALPLMEYLVQFRDESQSIFKLLKAAPKFHKCDFKQKLIYL